MGREDLAHTPSISKISADNMANDDPENTFLKLVKDITSKGFVRSNYKDKLVDLSKSLKVGAGYEEGTELTPVISSNQLEKEEGYE